MTIEQKEFCANYLCPHHKIPMTDKLHYHSNDTGVMSSTEGILYTHPYDTKKVTYKSKRKWFIIAEITEEIDVRVIYFCGVCHKAICMAVPRMH